jgi:hypothetical protein
MMPILSYTLNLLGAGTHSDTGGVSFSESVIHDPYMLATATTDEVLPMGGVTTASALYLYSSQTITVNLNSAAGTDIVLSANRPFFSTGLAVTAIYLSNASGSTASIVAFIAGV